jgi:hypothetical protein
MTDAAADPELSDGQLARLRAYGTPDELDVGEAAFAAGRLLEPGGPVFGVSLRRPEFELAVRAEAA